MKEKVIQNLEDFLNDFHYFKIEGYDAFAHAIEGGSKIIIINTTPYNDGLMLEIQLALRIDKIEQIIFEFQQQESSKLSFTYWESLSQIDPSISKRSFIQNEVELSKIIVEIEGTLVRKGFEWLDKLSHSKRLSRYLSDVIFNSTRKPSNIFKLCERDYLLRILLGESVTESDFYEYYEQMQVYKVPEHQLEEFINFRNYIKQNSI